MTSRSGATAPVATMVALTLNRLSTAVAEPVGGCGNSNGTEFEGVALPDLELRHIEAKDTEVLSMRYPFE